MDRRDFLKFASCALTLSGLDPWQLAHGAQAPVNSGMIVSGYRVGLEPYLSKNAGFTVTQNQVSERIQLANEIHSAAYSKKHDLTILLPKLDLEAAAWSKTGELRKFYPQKGNYFYGHGVVDELRDVLYVTQARITATRDESARRFEPGAVYVYALPDLKLLGSFESFGRDPHDLRLMGDELIVCNGGANSNVAVIDLVTRQLVRKYEVKVPHLSLRHIDIIDPQNFVIATLSLDENLPCPLYLLNRTHGLVAYRHPQNLELTVMRGQLLSVVSFQNKILTTCPATNTLLAWEKHGRFIGGHQIPNVASLAVSSAHRGVLVGSGNGETPLHLVTFAGNELKVERLNWGHGVTGSHAVIL